jgi:AraC-like DNA-binding protein
VLENLFQQTDTYEKQHQEDLLVRRKQFFLELLEGHNPVSPDVWQKQMNSYNLPDSFENLAVAVVEIDQYENFKQKYSVSDQNLLKFALTNVANEFSGEIRQSIWSEWISGNRLAMLYMEQRNSGSDGDAGSFADLLDKFRIWVAVNLKFSVTIGLGKTVTGLAEIRNSFDDALTAMQYKMSLGNNQVIGFADLVGKVSGDTYKYFQLFDTLVQDFKMANPSFVNQLTLFSQYLDQDVLKDDEIGLLLEYLLGLLERTLEELPSEIKQFWKENIKPQLASVIEDAETVEDLLPRVIHALERLYEQNVSIRESKSYHHLIKEIRKYIEENYANPDLSLNHISDKFSVNAKYSSQLFKEEFGMKFVDFLVNLRMEHAKKLLLETDDPIQEISLQVGYVQPISFGRAFKKIVGVTPGDFRKYRPTM